MAGMLKRFGGAAGVFLAAFLFVGTAHAAPSCPTGYTVNKWDRVTTTSPNFRFSSALLAYYNGSTTNTNTLQETSCTPSGPGPGYAGGSCGHNIRTSGGSFAGTFTAYYDCAPVIPNPCAAKTDDQVVTSGTGSLPTNWGQACIDNCSALMNTSVDLGSSWAAAGQYTGSACSGGSGGLEEKIPKLLPDKTLGHCVGDSCLSLSKQNCGYVNNEYRCITSTQLTTENPCVDTASGGRFCKEGAPTPPVPNNGTPGVPAYANAQFKLQAIGSPGYQQNSTHINYYSSSTVNGDSEDPGGEGPGDGDENGNGFCDEGETCTVKIDETGTPTTGEELEPANLDAFGDSLNQLANEDAGGAFYVGAESVIQELAARQCEQLDVSFSVPIYGQVSFQFPTDLGCQWIEKFKTALAWLLGIVTFVGIVHMWYREGAPRA